MQSISNGALFELKRNFGGFMLDHREIVQLLETVYGTEISNLQVEREKLVQLADAGAKCPGINAIDAVITAKKATLKSLPK